MRKIFIPVLTSFIFLIFLGGIHFIEKDSELYLTSPIFRTEPQKLSPGFRFIFPILFRVSSDIPDEKEFSPEMVKPRKINLSNLSEREISSFIHSLYIGGEYHRINVIGRNLMDYYEKFDEEVILILADSLLNTGYPEEALLILYRVLDRNINNHYTYYLLSKSYFLLQNYQNSLENISQALYLNPYDKNTLTFAFNIYLELGEFEKCSQFLQRISYLDKNDKDYVLLALDYYLINHPDPDKSISYLNKLKMHPTEQSLIDKYEGILAFYQNDFIKAIELLQRENIDAENSYYRLLFLSKSYLAIGMYKDAISLSEALLQNSQNLNDTFFYLAKLYTEAGNINEGIQHLMNIDRETLPDYYSGAFELLLQAEKYDTLLDLLETMVKRHPNDYTIYNRKGLIYLRKKELHLSLENYKKSLDIFPWQDDIIKTIREIEEIMNH